MLCTFVLMMGVTNDCDPWTLGGASISLVHRSLSTCSHFISLRWFHYSMYLCLIQLTHFGTHIFMRDLLWSSWTPVNLRDLLQAMNSRGWASLLLGCWMGTLLMDWIHKAVINTLWGPPSDVCWFINPMNTIVTVINSYKMLFLYHINRSNI